MKYRDENGDFQDLILKTGDTLPIGTEVDYDGETIPDGWEEVNNPFEYQPGQSIISGEPYSGGIGGFITTSATNLVFDVITPKSLKNISNIQVTNLMIRARSVTGTYLLTNSSNYANLITNKDSQGNNLAQSCISLSANKVNDNQIRITATFNDAIYSTNNTPVAVEYKSLHVLFE